MVEATKMVEEGCPSFYLLASHRGQNSIENSCRFCSATPASSVWEIRAIFVRNKCRLGQIYVARYTPAPIRRLSASNAGRR